MAYISEKKRLFIQSVIFFIVTGLIILFLPEELIARPGGGHSYSGGGGGGFSGGGGGFSGGSGGSGGESPITFILVFIIFIIAVIIRNKKLKKNGGVQLKSSAQIQNIRNKSKQISVKIQKLKEADPNFSRVLFMDFASSILYKFYSLSKNKGLYNLSPYFSKNTIDDYVNNGYVIFDVVIGSGRIFNIRENDSQQFIEVDFDFNYSLTNEGKNTRFHSIERWTFVRNKGVISPEPHKMRELSCPNCGSSLHFNDAGECQSCGSFIHPGEKQWGVYSFFNQKRNYFSTSGFAHYAQEVGTKERTITEFALRGKLEKFSEKFSIPYEEWKADFKEKIVMPYFEKMYKAWSENKLGSIRNLITDRLYESWMFWIKNYENEGLYNKLDNIKISKIDFAKLEEDKYYESLTVRIFASCFDYVEDKAGNLKGGSKSKLRKFSEYWTFIRRCGIEKNDFDLSTCPNCGAPADKIGQAGICEYCNTKISTGEFSWVLAVITQDEVYKG